MLERLKLTADQLRLALIGGATVLVVGAIGTTAALATSEGRTTEAQAEMAPRGARLLTIRTAAPAPLVMPSAPAESDRLAVLSDVPVDLSYDSDLRGALDAAAIQAVNAAEARRTAAETASWEREAADVQAQIEASSRPAYEPSTSGIAKPRAADGEITAAVGDTRSTVSAD